MLSTLQLVNKIIVYARMLVINVSTILAINQSFHSLFSLSLSLCHVFSLLLPFTIDFLVSETTELQRWRNFFLATPNAAFLVFSALWPIKYRKQKNTLLPFWDSGARESKDQREKYREKARKLRRKKFFPNLGL